ncbi:MAG: carboxylate--amine ligase [Gemmatimonadota bacterium]
MSGPPVVVMGLDGPTGLQVARVFAERGIEVIGIATDLRHPCVRTRSCSRVIRAERDPESMASALFELAKELEERAVLVPCTDLAVIGVARHTVTLQDHFLTAIPSHVVIEQLMDKAAFAEFATARGIPVPGTHVVRSRRDVERAARQTCYPCVLKPALKSVRWETHASAKALVAETPNALFAHYDRHAPLADRFVVQELVPGEASDHYTCDGYFSSDGTPLATFMSRKLRQWPPVVGQGCISVEHRNEQVREQAIRLFKEAGHQGQGYVESMWDARTGRYVVIEANVGRPTGRSTAAERAGVELLMTMYNDLVGAPLPEKRVQHYRGAKWIYVRRDLQACVGLLVRRRITPFGILRSWRGRFAFAVFSWRDPIPFLADLVRAARHVLSRPRKSGFKRSAAVGGRPPAAGGRTTVVERWSSALGR